MKRRVPKRINWWNYKHERMSLAFMVFAYFWFITLHSENSKLLLWNSVDVLIFFSCHDTGIELWYRCAIVDLCRQTTALLVRFWDCPRHSYQNEKDKHIDN